MKGLTVKVSTIEANKIQELLINELKNARWAYRALENGAFSNVENKEREGVLAYYQCEIAMLGDLIRRFGGVIPPEEKVKEVRKTWTDA